MTAADRDSERDPGCEVELEALTIGFGETVAIDDVSLTVQPGEFFTLVGPSGCGKTTTLRAIAGLEDPDSGTVHIGGTDVTDRPPEDRNVGIVFQNYALFSHMTVRENVAYGLKYREPPDDESADERVDSLLELVDMAGMDDRDPETLSGGQRQRVALARALAPRPDVLLLDEPLSALDARLRERLRVTVRQIQRELGITTIYVTHDQAEALAVSDRVAVVEEGRLEQVAPPERVYRQPASRFVAEFVGDNNLLDGEVVGSDPPKVAVDGVQFPVPTDAEVTPGESVTVTIRPEAISVRATGASERATREETEKTTGTTIIEATVTSREFLGDAYRLHCDWRGRTVLVKATVRDPPGGTVVLGIDPGDVHLL